MARTIGIVVTIPTRTRVDPTAFRCSVPLLFGRVARGDDEMGRRSLLARILLAHPSGNKSESNLVWKNEIFRKGGKRWQQFERMVMSIQCAMLDAFAEVV